MACLFFLEDNPSHIPQPPTSKFLNYVEKKSEKQNPKSITLFFSNHVNHLFFKKKNIKAWKAEKLSYSFG